MGQALALKFDPGPEWPAWLDSEPNCDHNKVLSARTRVLGKPEKPSPVSWMAVPECQLVSGLVAGRMWSAFKVWICQDTHVLC